MYESNRRHASNMPPALTINDREGIAEWLTRSSRAPRPRRKASHLISPGSPVCVGISHAETSRTGHAGHALASGSASGITQSEMRETLSTGEKPGADGKKPTLRRSRHPGEKRGLALSHHIAKSKSPHGRGATIKNIKRLLQPAARNTTQPTGRSSSSAQPNGIVTIASNRERHSASLAPAVGLARWGRQISIPGRISRRFYDCRTTAALIAKPICERSESKLTTSFRYPGAVLTVGGIFNIFANRAIRRKTHKTRLISPAAAGCCSS
jgi:hypothetical protein